MDYTLFNYICPFTYATERLVVWDLRSIGRGECLNKQIFWGVLLYMYFFVEIILKKYVINENQNLTKKYNMLVNISELDNNPTDKIYITDIVWILQNWVFVLTGCHGGEIVFGGRGRKVIGIWGSISPHLYNLATKYFYCYKLIMKTYTNIRILTHRCRIAYNYNFVFYVKLE